MSQPVHNEKQTGKIPTGQVITDNFNLRCASADTDLAVSYLINLHTIDIKCVAKDTKISLGSIPRMFLLCLQYKSSNSKWPIKTRYTINIKDIPVRIFVQKRYY